MFLIAYCILQFMKWKFYILSTSTLCILVFFHFSITKNFDAPFLFGYRTDAVFDFWSVQHFLGGILIGTVLLYFYSRVLNNLKELIWVVLTIAFGWEIIELAMESGIFGGAIAHWKDGFEHWGNRLIGDPLMFVLGGVVASYIPFSWKLAAAPASLWFIVNVVSPTSMYIQHLLLHR